MDISQAAVGRTDSMWPAGFRVLLATVEQIGAPDKKPTRPHRRPRSPLVRGYPGSGLALGGGDLEFGHHLGDLAAQLDGIAAALEGGEVEPFMRGNEIDHAGTPARPIQAAFEQHVGNGACFHRRRCIQIDVPLKHPSSPFVFCRLVVERGACPLVERPAIASPPLPACCGNHADQI